MLGRAGRQARLHVPCAFAPWQAGQAACALRHHPHASASHLPAPARHLAPQVLQADGGTRCACINAAFLALAAAAVPMRDVVAACAAGYLDSTALLDLNYMEDAGGELL